MQLEFSDTAYWCKVKNSLDTHLVYTRSRVKAYLGDRLFDELLARGSYIIKTLGFKPAIKYISLGYICTECNYFIAQKSMRCNFCISRIGAVNTSLLIRPTVAKPDNLWTLNQLRLKLPDIKVTGKLTLAKIKSQVSEETYTHLYHTIINLKIREIEKFIRCLTQNKICSCGKDVYYFCKTITHCSSCMSAMRALGTAPNHTMRKKVYSEAVDFNSLDFHFEVGKYLVNFLRYNSSLQEIHSHHISNFLSLYPELNVDAIMSGLDTVRKYHKMNSYIELLRSIIRGTLCSHCSLGYIPPNDLGWHVCKVCRHNPAVVHKYVPKNYKYLRTDNKSFVCRGYEAAFIKTLLNRGYPAESIDVDFVHKIRLHLKDKTTWWPDLLVNGTLIEIKSVWTLMRGLSKNRLKNKSHPDVRWFVGIPKKDKSLCWVKLPREWHLLTTNQLERLL